MAEQTTQEAIAEIWQLLRETAARQQETAVSQAVSQKETDARFKETDARFKENAAQIKEMTAGLDRLEGLFGDQWGKMLEALVQPSALRLFQARGIAVRRLHQRSKAQRNGDTMEVDLILENGADLVVVEVKSKLNVEAVDDLLADLAQFTDYFPSYRGYTIYGAVAGLHIVESADRYAYRQGLFVLSVGGEGMVQLLNDAKFKPRNFALASPPTPESPQSL
jgi:hypothetical protein